jgi:hypothetical protein
MHGLVIRDRSLTTLCHDQRQELKEIRDPDGRLIADCEYLDGMVGSITGE